MTSSRKIQELHVLLLMVLNYCKVRDELEWITTSLSEENYRTSCFLKGLDLRASTLKYQFGTETIEEIGRSKTTSV